jgi:hypothetical protein
MNAPHNWQAPPRARHLRVEDFDAEQRAEARLRSQRRWDRAVIAFGLVSLAYFVVRCLL